LAIPILSKAGSDFGTGLFHEEKKVIRMFSSRKASLKSHARELP
jgi:hypothetical protein